RTFFWPPPPSIVSRFFHCSHLSFLPSSFALPTSLATLIHLIYTFFVFYGSFRLFGLILAGSALVQHGFAGLRQPLRPTRPIRRLLVGKRVADEHNHFRR